MVVISRAPSPACAAAGPELRGCHQRRCCFQRAARPNNLGSVHLTQGCNPLSETLHIKDPDVCHPILRGEGRGPRKFRGETHPPAKVRPGRCCNSYGLKRPSCWRTCDGGRGCIAGVQNRYAPWALPRRLPPRGTSREIHVQAADGVRTSAAHLTRVLRGVPAGMNGIQNR